MRRSRSRVTDEEEEELIIGFKSRKSRGLSSQPNYDLGGQGGHTFPPSLGLTLSHSSGLLNYGKFCAA